MTNDDGALPPADQSARRKSIKITHVGRQLHCVAKRVSQQDWHETYMLPSSMISQSVSILGNTQYGQIVPLITGKIR